MVRLLFGFWICMKIVVVFTMLIEGNLKSDVKRSP